jgi:hypothetical protein
MRLLRIAVGTAGVAGMALGTVLLASPQVGERLAVLWWLGGAVLLHDGVLVPVVLAVGAVLPPRLRRSARGALITAACLTVVALPVLLRPGHPANPSLLPLDYRRNLLVALVAVAAVAAAWHARHAVRRLLRRPARRRPARRQRRPSR